MRAALEHGKCRIEVSGSDAKHDECRRRHSSLNAIDPHFAQIGPAENHHRRRREDPEQKVNPRQHARIDAGERVRIEEEAEHHDIHGEKAAHAELDQKPGGFPLLVSAALHLKGDATAVAAERASLTVEPALHRAQADGQRAMATEDIAMRSHAESPPSHAWPICASEGSRPRPSVMRPSKRIKPPASLTPRRRQAGPSIRPTPPIINIAGKVPSPNDAMTRNPGSAPAVLAAWAAKA